MSSRRLLSDVYQTHSRLLLLALFLGNCYAQTSPNCERPSTSCGNIHNIRHPFRVKGDPVNCGNKKYELECEHNRLLLYLSSSAKYYVHSINYDNYTIRLVDVGLQQENCSSLPLYSLSDLNFTNGHQNQYPQYELMFPYGFDDYVGYFESQDQIPWDMAVALWVDCEKPVKSRFYTESNTSASSCIDKATSSSSSSSSLSSGEKRHYSYFLFGSLKLSDVADQCKIDEILITTLWLPNDKSQENISYSDFHDKLEYGFELSWLSSFCEQCHEQGRNCRLGSNYSVTCYKYHYCPVSLKESRSFLCWLEIFYDDYFGPGYKLHGFTIIALSFSLDFDSILAAVHGATGVFHLVAPASPARRHPYL